MLRVFESFAGVGSQRMALRNLGIEYEIVGISEIDGPAVLSYAAIHTDFLQKRKDIDKYVPSEGEMRDYLKEINAPLDYKTFKNKADNLKGIKLKEMYLANVLSKNYGDITKIKPSGLPDMDLFTYSFPCQDLSVAGKQKGLGEGTRSGLLYECEKIIETKRPKYLLLENVKNLVGEKFKLSFDRWLERLEELGYKNYWKVINSYDHGTPQKRERVYVVSILGEEKFTFPEKRKNYTCVKEILCNQVEDKYYYKNKPIILVNKKDVKAEFTDRTFHQGRVVFGINGGYQTLCAGDRGINNIIYPRTNERLTIDEKDKMYHIYKDYVVRKLMPIEFWRLMCFKDEDFSKANQVVSNTQLCKQAGNSIVVSVLEDIFKNLFL